MKKLHVCILAVELFALVACSSSAVQAVESSVAKKESALTKARPQHPPIRGPRNINEKLDIVIEDIAFENVDLNTILDWVSRYADLPIVIDPGIFASPLKVPSSRKTSSKKPDFKKRTTEPIDFKMPGQPETIIGSSDKAARSEPVPHRPTTRYDLKAADIKLKLRRIPVRELLRYVLLQKNLIYRVEDYAIVITRPGIYRPEEMRLKMFRLSVGSLELKPLPAPAGGGRMFQNRQSRN